MGMTETEATLPGGVPEAAEHSWAPSRLPVRVSRRTVRLLVLAAVVVAAVGSYAVGRRWLAPATVQNIQLYTVTRKSFPILLTTTGELKAANSVEVRSEVEGRATIISLVAEGTQVKQGDLLVELASDEIDEKIRDLEIKETVAAAAYEAAVKELEILKDKNQSEERKAALALDIARLSLEKYRKGESKELRKESEIAVKQTEEELQRAKDYLKDSEELFKEGFITRIERERDEFEAWKAENELEKMRVRAEVLEKWTIPMDLQKKESDVEEAEAELERTKKASKASEEKAVAEVNAKKDELGIVRDKLSKAREQKKKTRIVAPADGLVVYYKEDWWDETRIKTGTELHERQPIIELPDTSSMKVVVRVHETQIERLKEGLTATVTLEGYSGRQYPGKVIKIGTVADSAHRWMNPNTKEYLTEILIEGTTNDLKPGGTAKVDLLVTQLNDVVAVPVQAVFGKGGKYYVFVDDRGNARPTEIEAGLASTEYVEIKKGLDIGQEVRLAITDEMNRLLPDDKEKEEKAGKGTEAKKRGAPPASAPSMK
ncbi:MAG: efflux RND transporter periplasmic adaptor subunit [Phycisphaerae bacterium]|nr:efflux RND transporter periplasmic adaptor subunit [Phycisphaerae bacterium]